MSYPTPQGEKANFTFEPRDYLLMQWYVPVSFTLLTIMASKWMVSSKQALAADNKVQQEQEQSNKVTESVADLKKGDKAAMVKKKQQQQQKKQQKKKNELLSRVQPMIMAFLESYLAMSIIKAVQEHPIEEFCQFFALSQVNYLVYLAYLLNLIQVLIQIPQTEVYGKEELFTTIRRVMASWIIIFQRVGYNWVVVLRNLFSSFLIQLAQVLGFDRSIVKAIEDLSDLSLVLLYVMRVAALISMKSGSSFCSGAFPSVVADTVFATLALWKLFKSRWLSTKRHSTTSQPEVQSKKSIATNNDKPEQEKKKKTTSRKTKTE